MVDVFISYSRSDEAQVRILSDAVKRLGYAVWWDDELPPHLSYGDVITDKIDKARAAIVVWSAEAAASEWVRAEADVARNQKKLIQTSLDGRMPPMPFNQIQFAEIGGWRGEDDHPGWTKVKASLAALCGPPGGATWPTAAVAPPPQPVTARPKAARSPLVPVLLGALALAAPVVLFLFVRGTGPAPVATANQSAAAATSNQAGDAALPVRTDARFSEAATIEAAAGSAELRSGPSPEAFLVGRVNRGDVVTTYPQTGDWWQIRAADGSVGYVPRAAVHVMALGAAAPRPVVRPARPQLAPSVAAPTPAPVSAPAPIRAPVVASVAPPLRPHMAPNLHGNPGFPPGVINPHRYCKGPGRGTPPCRGMPEN